MTFNIIEPSRTSTLEANEFALNVLSQALTDPNKVKEDATLVAVIF